MDGVVLLVRMGSRRECTSFEGEIKVDAIKL
jgi:hypothetical protein